MGSTSIPCPACFQTQTIVHENGATVESHLCAACEEEAGQLGLDQARYVKAAHALRASQAEANS